MFKRVIITLSRHILFSKGGVFSVHHYGTPSAIDCGEIGTRTHINPSARGYTIPIRLSHGQKVRSNILWWLLRILYYFSIIFSSIQYVKELSNQHKNKKPNLESRLGSLLNFRFDYRKTNPIRNLSSLPHPQPFTNMFSICFSVN